MSGIKKFIKRIIKGKYADSETYIQYLRKNGCSIGEGVHFYSPKTTTIDEVRMNWISIGNFTKITQGVIILAHDYAPSVLVHTHKNVVLGGGYYTSIGNNCFIGMNSIIMPGVKIGNNCIVGAGSVVKYNIPDNSVCAGNPAKVIMSIDEYNQKRKNKYLQDAQRNVNHFYDVNHRFPSTEELHGFSFLYLEKTAENWNKYFTKYLNIDNDSNDVKQAFFATQPVFENYDDFINYCKESKEI